MIDAIDTPGFTTWDSVRLREQRDHLETILMTMAGQRDPLKPRLRAELAAIRAEITKRAEQEPTP